MEELNKNSTGIFTRTVVLPSKGKFYTGKFDHGPMSSEGKVEIRPITVQEEKLISVTQDRLALLDKLFSRCLLSQELPLDDYLMTDKFFILLSIKTISYGSDLSFKAQCACGGSFVKEVFFDKDLRIVSAAPEDIEPFPVELPMSGRKLECRFLRGYDEKDIDNYVKSLPRVPDDEDPSYAYRLSKHIVTIDGKTPDPVEALMFCENLIGADSSEIRESVAERETGVDLRIEAKCPSCRRTFVTRVDVTANFFRSGIRKGS